MAQVEIHNIHLRILNHKPRTDPTITCYNSRAVLHHNNQYTQSFQQRKTYLLDKLAIPGDVHILLDHLDEDRRL
jgi:hypothetical protein